MCRYFKKVAGFGNGNIFWNLKDCLIEILHLNILDKYKPSRYGIGFDRKGFFLVDNGVGKNAMIFGVDMSSSQHIKKQI